MEDEYDGEDYYDDDEPVENKRKHLLFTGKIHMRMRSPLRKYLRRSHRSVR